MDVSITSLPLLMITATWVKCRSQIIQNEINIMIKMRLLLEMFIAPSGFFFELTFSSDP